MVTRSDFVNFLEAKKAGIYKCVFCANDAFIVNVAKYSETGGVVEAGKDDPALLHLMAYKTTNPAGHAFYSISCSNCGFGTFFHYNQIKDWLETQAKEKAETKNVE